MYKKLSLIFGALIVFVSLAVPIASVKATVDGCTDQTATNYNSMADNDDGSCQYTFTTSVTDGVNTSYSITHYGFNILNNFALLYLLSFSFLIFVLSFTIGRSLMKR